MQEYIDLTPSRGYFNKHEIDVIQGVGFHLRGRYFGDDYQSLEFEAETDIIEDIISHYKGEANVKRR